MPVAQCFSPCFTVGTPLHTGNWWRRDTSIAQRHAAGRKSDGRNRAQSAAGRGAAEKMP
jgi:hypothetical protein